ncbi:MAG: hypothetical protein QXK51_01500 [Candidatus Methanomethylicia archaeon]
MLLVCIHAWKSVYTAIRIIIAKSFKEYLREVIRKSAISNS